MRERRLGIGIVVTYLPRDKAGGAQLQAVGMARELAKSHDVVLFARGGGNASAGLDLGHASISLSRSSLIPGLRLILDSRALVRRIKERLQELDVLVCYQTLSSGLVGTMARSMGLPFLVYVRGRHEYRMDRLNQFRLFAPRVYGAADRVLVQDRSIADELLANFDRPRFNRLRERLKNRLRVIPNGVERRQRREGTGRYLIYVGRLIEPKGVQDLLQALRSNPPVELVVIGDGPQRPRLQALASGLPITWMGQQPHGETLKHIADSMCLVLPSHSEAFPNVILEAMSLGVPVVGTRVGGVPTLVRSGENGILIPPGDVAALSEVLAKVAGSESMRRSMGERAYDLAAEFSWEAATGKLVAEIEAVLSSSDATREGSDK